MTLSTSRLLFTAPSSPNEPPAAPTIQPPALLAGRHEWADGAKQLIGGSLGPFQQSLFSMHVFCVLVVDNTYTHLHLDCGLRHMLGTPAWDHPNTNFRNQVKPSHLAGSPGIHLKSKRRWRPDSANYFANPAKNRMRKRNSVYVCSVHVQSSKHLKGRFT